jgi:hypothetical protein
MDKKVVFNVDGEIVQLTVATLAKYPNNLFANLAKLEKTVIFDEREAICINRDNTYLSYIVEYMESKTLPKSKLYLTAVREEAKFYHLGELVQLIDKKLEADPLVPAFKTVIKPRFDGN